MVELVKNNVTEVSRQVTEMPEAVTDQIPQPNISETEAQKKVHQSIPEEFMHKNRLQEYSQRSSLPLPLYQTVNEGAQHAPLFRSSVLVDGIWFTNPRTFSHRKTAEQEVAKVALRGIKQRTKDEGCPLIREDTVFCKSIINEYAVKMNLEKPTYHTVQTEALLPVFKSTLVFNGINYTGDIGKNKKEAEQLAARAVILSILETECGIIMSEIIKSKRKLYAALDKVKETGDNAGFMPMEHTGDKLGVPVSMDKSKEVEVMENAVEKTDRGASVHSFGQPTIIQGPHLFHAFKKPKTSSSVEESHPIAFVPPVMDPALLSSTSGRKRRRKNKKVKKNVQVDPQFLPARWHNQFLKGPSARVEETS